MGHAARLPQQKWKVKYYRPQDVPHHNRTSYNLSGKKVSHLIQEARHSGHHIPELFFPSCPVSRVFRTSAILWVWLSMTYGILILYNPSFAFSFSIAAACFSFFIFRMFMSFHWM